MAVTNLFFKVVLEHDDEEKPERVGEEIRRHFFRFYGVREAEFTHFTTVEE